MTLSQNIDWMASFLLTHKSNIHTTKDTLDCVITRATHTDQSDAQFVAKNNNIY